MCRRGVDRCARAATGSGCVRRNDGRRFARGVSACVARDKGAGRSGLCVAVGGAVAALGGAAGVGALGVAGFAGAPAAADVSGAADAARARNVADVDGTTGAAGGVGLGGVAACADTVDAPLAATSFGRDDGAVEPCKTTGSAARTGTSSRPVGTGGLVPLFGAARVTAAAPFVATSLAAPARVRRGGAGRAGVAAVDSASGGGAVRAEGARRRTGAGLAGGALGARSPVGFGDGFASARCFRAIGLVHARKFSGKRTSRAVTLGYADASTQ